MIRYEDKEFSSLRELNDYFVNCGLTAFDEVEGLEWEELKVRTIKCHKFGPAHVHYIYLTLFRVSDGKSEMYVVTRSDVNSCCDYDKIYVWGWEESIFDEAVDEFVNEGFKLA